MSEAFKGLAEAYASLQGARSAWFVRARHVPETIAKLGLIGPSDRLVVRANDFTDAYLHHFGNGVLTFAMDQTPEAFLDATRSSAHPAAGGPKEGHASYADGAGARYDRLFWLVNSIGCRGLRVPDIRALAEAAREAGAILIVDNTVASAWGCQPLSLGAHIVLEALDRVAGGALHAKAVAIAVARSVAGKGRKRCTDELAHRAYCLLAQRLGGEFSQLVFNVDDADLAIIREGLQTLGERMQRHTDHARVIAEYLAAHPLVPQTCYPGLKSHPDHDVAARTLMHGFGPAVDFELAERMCAGTFIKRCAASHRDHPAGGRATRLSPLCGDESHYIRLFAGLDDPIDIVDSLEQAMRLYCNPPHA